MKRIITLPSILSAIALTFTFNLSAQLPIQEVDPTRISKDIVTMRTNSREIQMALWMPDVYWKVVGAQNKQVPKGAVDDIVNALKDYVVVCVAQTEFTNNTASSLTTTPESKLRQIVSLNYNGQLYKAISYNDLNESAQLMKNRIEPMLKQMMGQLGDGMTVFYFQVQDKNHKNLINPYQTGSFSILIGSIELKYNLPLACLYPDKVCTDDQQNFPANYTYCPFHGSLLQQPVIDEMKVVEPQQEMIIPPVKQ